MFQDSPIPAVLAFPIFPRSIYDTRYNDPSLGLSLAGDMTSMLGGWNCSHCDEVPVKLADDPPLLSVSPRLFGGLVELVVDVHDVLAFWPVVEIVGRKMRGSHRCDYRGKHEDEAWR